MMKTSSTKRVLAFWLAVAILGAPASGAFAAGLTTLQSTVQAAEMRAEVKLEKSFGQTIQDEELKQALIDAKVATETDTIAYAVASDATSKEVLQYSSSAVTFLKTGTGKITATITPAASASISDVSPKTQDITITVTQADLANATITLTDADNLVYDNTAKQPAVSKVSLNSVDLTSSDYDVSYENNTNAGEASVKITGKGNYTGTAIKNFNIGKANLTNLSSISPIKVNQNAGKDAVKQELDKQKIQADGVASEKVSGTFELTNVEQTSKSPSDLDTFTQNAGDYIITATFTPTDNNNYNPKTDVKINCTVTPAESSFTVQEASAHALKNLTVGTPVSDVELKSLVTVSPDTPDTYTYAVKGDLPAGLSESNGKISGTPKTAGTGSFTVTVTDKQQVSKEAAIHYSVSAQASTAQVITLDSATIANGKVYDGNTDIDPKSIEVKLSGDTAAQAIRDTDYTVSGKFNDANVGTDKTVTVTVTLTDEGQKKYTFANDQKSATTTVNNVTITKAKYTADGVVDNALAVAVSGNKGSTVYGKIPDAMAQLKPTYTVETVTDTASILNGTPIVNGNSVKIQLKDTAAENQTATIPVKVSFQNYEDVTITYTVKVVSKKDVSNDIQFENATVTYDKKPHSLKPATLSGVTAGQNPKWTYTYTKNTADTSKVPEFTEVGVYQITATYEDDDNWGQKTATLTIEAAASTSSITVTAEQRKGLADDNYNNFSIRLRDEANGYIRILADANDYLDRQEIDNTNSEWIGMEITPKVSGGAVNVETLYVSTNGSSWNKLSKGTYGNFYLDGVQGNSFYLWYDTNDRDSVDDLYLATDSMGANKFQIRVDFDAYSTSSGGSSSGSSSSSTDKVNGDKVSTTTVDKTPTVKGNHATVSISSSTLDDALEKNKKESKREDADKSFIELDVKTSKSVDDTTVTVPVKSLDDISDADTGLSLVTNQGTIQMDYHALSKIVSAADKKEVDISIEEDTSNQYTLLIKDGSNEIIDLGSGEAEITFSYRLKSGEKASDVKVYRVGDGNTTWLSTYGGSTVYAGTETYAAATGSYVTNMNADYNSSKKKITFATDALGTFLVTTDTLQTNNKPDTSYPSPSTFIDVPASRWSAQYINKLASLGIINGTGGGYFEPTLYVSREEFVKMLAGVAGANVSGYTSQRFPDVSAYRWSAPYIAWAVDHGITTGTDGGNFAPTMKITREEMATMIYRYTQSAGKVLPTKNVPTVFSDAHLISSWAQTPVSVIQQAGIIDGNVVNGRYSFDPKVPATREECAKMLCLLYDLI
ncbi:MAG: S-layer homology domain-containing protein [Butyricicoccus pullicaecorum]|nr:S-layer homology domain-containing protein [Butyricicoccus pullicaecorum]